MFFTHDKVPWIIRIPFDSAYQVLEKEEAVKEEKKEEVEEEEEEEESGSTLFIKNLNFSTTEEKLQEVSQLIKTTLS